MKPICGVITLICSMLCQSLAASEQRPSATTSGQWPAQPYKPKHLREIPFWPADKVASRRIGEIGFCAGAAIEFQHPAVMRGGLMASPAGALFFPTRSDLDLFEGPLHAIAQAVRFLPASHPMQALEDIPADSAGGRVRDELFGDGFARWPPDSDDRFPDWMELWHDNNGGVCGGHDFMHHPIRPHHRAFVRPRWPATRNRHLAERRKQDEKRGANDLQRRLRLEHDF